MSLIDSIYTDPEALRRLYLNRRAIADMLPDAQPVDAGGGTITSGGSSVPPLAGGAGGGTSGGDGFEGGKGGGGGVIQE